MKSGRRSIENLSTELVYQFCCWNSPERVTDILKNYQDVDLLYNEGIIVRLMIAHLHADLLRLALNYFEKIQFPEKNSDYFEKSDQLIEILEEHCNGLEITKVIHEYVDEDIAVLKDVASEDEFLASDAEESDCENLDCIELDLEKICVKVTRPYLNAITLEDYIQAAKTGDTELIKQSFDIKNPTNTPMLICTAIQHGQSEILNTIVDMATDDKQKAVIYRFIGDAYTAHGKFFAIGLSCYKNALIFHPNCYITYFKMGTLYQLWNESLPTFSISFLNKAVECFTLAQNNIPGGEYEYYHLRTNLKTVQEQLSRVTSENKPEGIVNLEISDEFLLYISDDDEEHSKIYHLEEKDAKPSFEMAIEKNIKSESEHMKNQKDIGGQFRHFKITLPNSDGKQKDHSDHEETFYQVPTP